MEQYNIEVPFAGKNIPLLIKPIDEGKLIKYQVIENDKLVFTLECCTDEVGDTLKLSPEFSEKGIDQNFVDTVADIIQSEEE